MRFSSYALPALAANLVAALPAPQEIDLDMVIAAPDPVSYSEAIGVTAQTVTLDIAAAAAQATAAISSVAVDAADVLSSTAVAQNKRAAATCAPQPSGAVSISSPDTPDAFLADPRWSTAALDSSASAPSGYTQTFADKKATNNAFIYMGFDTFKTYDVATCAKRCSSKLGCISFNMYFERDPSVNPDDAACSNPASVVMIKCAYWGGPISAANANNFGQPRGNFSVVVAGSNGYVSTSVSTPAGFSDAVAYGDKAINAPYDAQGYNTFMGSKIFTQSSFNTSLCSDYCNSQTQYNKATAPKDGTPYKVCNYFNTYMLYLNPGGSTKQQSAQGQYCALYTEPWTSKYATNAGQWRGTDQYVVSYSFGFSKPNAGIDPLVGDAVGAAYQAVADIKWSSLQPFCTTYLGYATPLATVTALATVTPVVTSFAYATTTVDPMRKRDDSSSLHPGLTLSGSGIPVLMDANGTKWYESEDSSNLSRRVVPAVSVPEGLSKYQPAVISSACAMQVTKPATSVVTSFSTVTAAATTTVSSVISIATSKVDNMSFNISDWAYNGPAELNTGDNAIFVNFRHSMAAIAAEKAQFAVDATTGYLTHVASGNIAAAYAGSDVGSNDIVTVRVYQPSSLDPEYAPLICAQAYLPNTLSCSVTTASGTVMSNFIGYKNADPQNIYGFLLISGSKSPAYLTSFGDASLGLKN